MTVTAHTFTPTHDRQIALRKAFSCFGTGVTVVTVNTTNGPVGMTANSFSSISLNPPLVLWAPSVLSLRHTHFVNAKQFCIHVLGAHQLEMAEHFAKHDADFSPFDWQLGPLDAPQISGCLAEFHCTTHAIHPAGDHSLILGEVRHVVQNDSGAQGLLFDQGRFGSFKPL